MVAIPLPPRDITLRAVDRAVEAEGSREPRRPYLGMSAMGSECDRRLWYEFRWAAPDPWPAETLYKFEDGHRTEAAMAERLRKVPGIMLRTVDPGTGRQFEFADFGGHFRGHVDGFILGLLEAPKTEHVWEHKACDEAEIRKLEKCRDEHGEKRALEKWAPHYYAQAVLYMHYSGLRRHFLTASTPGGRRTISVRTEANPTLAKKLREKAERVIFTDYPPSRIGGRDHYYCVNFCRFRTVCHQETLEELPGPTHCRLCLHSTVHESGDWSCAKRQFLPSVLEQRSGCPSHLFNPKVVPGEQIDATEDSVLYQIAGRRVMNRAGEEFVTLSAGGL